MITACLELLSQRKFFCPWMLLFIVLGCYCSLFLDVIVKHIAVMNIIIWQGKSECSDWFFLGQDLRTVTMETVISCVFFVFEARKFKTSMAQVPYYKLLTNVASSSRTGEYWASVFFVQILLPQPRANISQYCPCAWLVRG